VSDSPSKQAVPTLPPIDASGFLASRIASNAALLGIIVGLLLLISGAITSALVSISVTVDSSGTLELHDVAAVRARKSGIVSRVLVSDGDTVEAGTPLLHLFRDEDEAGASALRLSSIAENATLQRMELERFSDSVRLLALEQEVRARRDRAKANLIMEISNFSPGLDVDSLLKAHRPGRHARLDIAVADVELSNAELTRIEADRFRLGALSQGIRSQRSKIEGIEGQFLLAEKKMGQLTIFAPKAGIVMRDQVHNLMGAAVREGDLLLEIGSPGAWRANLLLSEASLAEISIGNHVMIELLSESGTAKTRFSGTIRTIRTVSRGIGNAPDMQPEAFTHLAVAFLDPASLDSGRKAMLKRGLSVRARIVTRRERIFLLLLEKLR
jgi:multidrug resistance efflux pump